MATGGIETYWWYQNSYSSSNYIDANAEKQTNRDTFFINDSTLSSEVGRSDRVFVRMYSNLIIPDNTNSNTHSFYLRTRSDDGIQVWLDKGSGYESVISNRTNHPPTYNSSSQITVSDNQSIPIKLEWWEHGGGAYLDLQWSTDNSNWTRIPSSSLLFGSDSASLTETDATSANGTLTISMLTPQMLSTPLTP